MQATVEYEPLVKKLLEKSEQGRLNWEKIEPRVGPYLPVEGIEPDPPYFACALEGQAFFQSRRTDQGYQLIMKDQKGNELFSITGEEAVLYDDPKEEELFKMLRDIYELARKKALNVNEKIATAVGLLDRI
jgi:hypothetical protein